MSETRVGELCIELKAKTEELEKGLNIAKKKIQEIEKQNKEVKESNKGLEASYLALSAVAVGALVKITGVIKDSIAEYNNYTQAMSSLKDVANYAGQSMSDFGDIMSDFSTYMTQDDLAATIKNFTLMGYSADDTRKMIEALTNSAIKNRNANYTVSQAVKVASDGYKQGLSTLSDSAGVTENLSVMLTEYAKTLGKTASQLTEAEKNQAYLNRTMLAAEPFASAMSDYMDTLAGKQGTYNQAIRETQVAFGEALEPAMSTLLEILTAVMQGVTGLIEANPALVAGVTAGTVAVSLLTIGVIALKKAKDAYTKSALHAAIAQQGFNAAISANPLMAFISVATLVIGAVVGLGTALKETADAQERLNKASEESMEIMKGSYEYTDEHAQSVKNNISVMQEQIEYIAKIKALQKEKTELYSGERNGFLGQFSLEQRKEATRINNELEKYQKALKESREENVNWGNSVAEITPYLEEQTNWLMEYNENQKIKEYLDTNAVRTEKKQASQLVLTAKEHRKYLETIKNGVKGTEEYENAIEALAKEYPEAVSASGPLIDELEELISKKEDDAEASYKDAQAIIDSNNKVLTAILGDSARRQQVADDMGIPVEELIEKLQTAISLYGILGEKSAEEMGGTYTSKKSSSSSSYSNEALDNYKKQIDYKKNLDKISAEEEIEMYEYALKKLAKTNDEKMDLEVEIYKLRKQLIEDYISTEQEALEERTEASERWIEEQKSLLGSEFTSKDMEEAYQRIIDYHKEYLDKMVTDERLSLEQKEAIWKEEINKIKDYQKQIRDIRIETVDNTYEALKNALTEQANQLQEVEENAVNKSLETLENSKNKKIEMINEEYNARIQAIDDELKALEEAEKQKTRQEEQADYEKKKKRLEELIAYEHDAVTKASYEKELAKLNEEYQKTLDEQALEDKKEALNNEKTNLKDEQQAKLDSINSKYDKEKEYLENRLTAIQDNYDKEREMADKNAQMMLLNTEQHQEEIINLLKTYGDEYELLGTTWGERVVNAFEDKIQGIVETVENLNSQLNQAIDNKLQSIASGSNSAYLANQSSYYNSNKSAIDKIANEKGVDVGVATDIHKNQNSSGGSSTTIVQNNTFNVPAEKPSTLLQKLQKTAQNLGELVRGS